MSFGTQTHIRISHGCFYILSGYVSWDTWDINYTNLTCSHIQWYILNTNITTDFFKFAMINFYFDFKSCRLVNIYIVLKTGPDRPVELVRPETGEVTSSSKPTDRPCNQTSVNRHDPARTGQNRRLGGFSNRTGSLFRKERTEE